jgi:hypothetical protein
MIGLLHFVLAALAVDRRRSKTPRMPGRLMSCRADRRRDPTPTNNGAGMKRPNPAKLQAQVDAWNAANKIGAEVLCGKTTGLLSAPRRAAPRRCCLVILRSFGLMASAAATLFRM